MAEGTIQALARGRIEDAHADRGGLHRRCRAYQIAERVLTRWRHEVRLRTAEAAFTPRSGPRATPDYKARIARRERVCG